jgi:hypothetical protein
MCRSSAADSGANHAAAARQARISSRPAEYSPHLDRRVVGFPRNRGGMQFAVALANWRCVMPLVHAGLRPALALLVIAHGLAHAALPLRGWMDPARFGFDFSPLLVYWVALIGFTVAGLGLIGVRMLEGAIRPALVLASAYSMIGMWVMGTDGLWWGRSLDIGLFFTGLTGAYRYLPAFHIGGHPGRAVFKWTAVAVAIYGAVAVGSWPLHRAWGSEPKEHLLALPGDHAARQRGLEVQHAVTIDAPPEQVWPWLVQIGQDRAGFYGYDWVERAFGVEARSFVRELQPNRAMVLDSRGAFVLEPLPDSRTRFIIRATVGHERVPAWAAALDMMALEMPHFIMQRKMMLTIKSLAEARAES